MFGARHETTERVHGVCLQTVGRLWISHRMELDDTAAHTASVPLPSTGIMWGTGNCRCRCGCLPSDSVKHVQCEGDGVMGVLGTIVVDWGTYSDKQQQWVKQAAVIRSGSGEW